MQLSLSGAASYHSANVHIAAGVPKGLGLLSSGPLLVDLHNQSNDRINHTSLIKLELFVTVGPPDQTSILSLSSTAHTLSLPIPAALHHTCKTMQWLGPLSHATATKFVAT